MTLKLKIPAIAVALASLVRSAVALPFPIQIDGKVREFWVEDVDLTVTMDVNGPCGSSNFRVYRSAANFQEMTATILTAASSGRTLRFELTGCSGTVNIVGHGAALFPG